MIATVLLYAGLAFQQNINVSAEAVVHARAGLAAKQQGNMTKAIEEFKKVTELAPDLPAGFVNLGAAYLDTRQCSLAIGPLKHALEMKADLPGAERMLGYALLAAGYAAESIPYLDRTKSTDALGIAQVKTGQFPEAINTLQQALREHPGDPDLLYYLGKASGLLSKDTFDSLIANYPNSARSHLAIAENYAALKRIPEAEQEFNLALKLRNDTPGIHLALGQLYASAGQWDKAEAEFEKESQIQPGDAETIYRVGNAQLTNGKAMEALKTLEQADKLKPQMPETLYSLGKAASLAGDTKLAEQSWKALIGVEPEGQLAAQAHFGLAALYRKAGKADRASAEMAEYKRLQNPQK